MVMTAPVAPASAVACPNDEELLICASAAQARQLAPGYAEEIQRAIHMLPSQAERHMAMQWPVEKQLAEFVCLPVARSVLAQARWASRVFLGNAEGSDLMLTSAGELEGAGSYRQASKWYDFTFTCVLDKKPGQQPTFFFADRPRQPKVGVAPKENDESQ